MCTTSMLVLQQSHSIYVNSMWEFPFQPNNVASDASRPRLHSQILCLSHSISDLLIQLRLCLSTWKVTAWKHFLSSQQARFMELWQELQVSIINPLQTKNANEKRCQRNKIGLKNRWKLLSESREWNLCLAVLNWPRLQLLYSPLTEISRCHLHLSSRLQPLNRKICLVSPCFGHHPLSFLWQMKLCFERRDWA